MEDFADLIVGRKTTFARSLQASIDSCKFLRGRVIRASAKPGINLKRDFREFDLSSLRPILDASQCFLKNLGCHASKYSMTLVNLKSRRAMALLCTFRAYPSATASLQAWNGSVAPLLVSPSRSTTLGQANFIGKFWIRASS